MATASVSNTFTNATPADADQVNENFGDVTDFLNNSTVHIDGSKAMTSSFDAGSNKIVNVTAGTAGTDAVNKTQMAAADAVVLAAAEAADAVVQASVTALDDALTDTVAAHTTQLGDMPMAIQAGRTTVSLDGSGLGTITFPEAFSEVPTVTLTVQLSSSAQRTVHINTLAADQIAIRCFSGGTLEVSTTRVVHWVAMGTLA